MTATPGKAEVPVEMVPWHGGDSAPEDWDGGWVLLADGEHWGPFNDPTGGWATWDMPDCSTRRIIAYTPRAASPEHADGEVVQGDRDVIARLVATHWPNGCWWQPDGTYAGSTDSGHSFEGQRHTDAVTAWAGQVADTLIRARLALSGRSGA